MYLWVSYGTFRKRTHHLVRKQRQNDRVRDTEIGGGFLREGGGHLPPLLSPRGVVPGLATGCEL